jgi:tetratricopeptide (TPR) repeat protein
MQRHVELLRQAIEIIRKDLVFDQQPRKAKVGWFARRRLRKGARLLEDAVLLTHDRYEPRWWLGKIHQRLGDHDKALKWFLEARRLEPEKPSVALESGNEALEVGDNELAVHEFGQFAAVPGRTQAALLHNLGVALLLTGRTAEAHGALTQSASLLADVRASRMLNAVEDVRAGRRPGPRHVREL